MTVTIKLDVPLEERLRLRAASTGRSTSEVVRAALLAYLDAPDADSAQSAFALGQGLFGRHAGPVDLAQGRKQAVAEVWGAKHARRGA